MNYSGNSIKLWARLGPNATYGTTLDDLASQQSDIVALTADLKGLSGLGRFETKHPERFFNMGIAEQDMIGTAGGLAKEGFIPFASAQSTFVSARAADQVRVCMAYAQLPIKLIGLVAGFSLGSFGPTHMGLEDISIMRAMPGITILSPADSSIKSV